MVLGARAAASLGLLSGRAGQLLIVQMLPPHSPQGFKDISCAVGESQRSPERHQDERANNQADPGDPAQTIN